MRTIEPEERDIEFNSKSDMIQDVALVLHQISEIAARDTVLDQSKTEEIDYILETIGRNGHYCSYHVRTDRGSNHFISRIHIVPLPQGCQSKQFKRTLIYSYHRQGRRWTRTMHLPFKGGDK